MKKIIAQLQELISSFPEKLSGINEDEFAVRPSPEKWSRKEELGHLIDSAHNNLRRFIVGQYETNPNIVYDQNFWVPAANYLHQPSQDLITLWKLLNLQVCEVLKSMPEKNFSRTVNTGKATVELHTIEWLAEDYVKHAKHHLHHILELEAIPY
jgi:hypothetical protein